MSVVPEVMDRDLSLLEERKEIAVRQTRRGCIQEMLGCEAKDEFKITPADGDDVLLMALEESSCLIRYFCKAQRPWTTNVTKDGAPFVEFERPFRCMPAPCKCCCMQEMTTKAGEATIGSFKENFYFCIPTFGIFDAAGTKQYNLHMQTCCGGMCVDVCAGGCCNCKIPFYIYKHDEDEPGKHVGEIVKVWGGMTSELFTAADTFMVKYPEGSDVNTKANLIGATLMINQLYFEAKKQ